MPSLLPNTWIAAFATALALAGCAAPTDATSVTTSADTVAATSGTIRFAANAWTPSVTGAVVAGETVGIDFAASRLPQCRDLNRNTAWSIRMYYQFDGGPISYILVASPGIDLNVKKSLDIPAGTTNLTVWFENASRSNGERDIVCQAWDSDYGQNYSFAVQ